MSHLHIEKIEDRPTELYPVSSAMIIHADSSNRKNLPPAVSRFVSLSSRYLAPAETYESNHLHFHGDRRLVHSSPGSVRPLKCLVLRTSRRCIQTMFVNFPRITDVLHIAKMDREVRLEPKYPFSYRGCFIGRQNRRPSSTAFLLPQLNLVCGGLSSVGRRRIRRRGNRNLETYSASRRTPSQI
jgi:hypothetical protein